ncbi:MAG: aldehyde dehydrogenase family protein [bacterium]
MNEQDISRLVEEVLSRLEFPSGATGPGASVSGSSDDPVFLTVDEAVDCAEKAQAAFHEMGLEARRRIIESIRQASLRESERLARMAHEETGMGRWQDKLQKNLLVSARTPGVEDLSSRSYTGDKGLTLVEYAPFGVVAAVTPSTNPTATIISNAIGMLAAGNSVVFSPHPAARKCSQETVRIINGAILAAGGPFGLVATVCEPSQESTRQLLAHPKAGLNVVTGGPAIVKVAMTTGKTCKVIAAGPGNPPVVVDDTAIFPKCAEDIITGAGFDNGVLCIAEKQVIVQKSAREKLLAGFRKDPRACELSSGQMDEVTGKAILEGGRGCRDPRLNREYIGKNASFIAKAIGLNISDDIRVLWSEVPNDHPFIWTEQLMPVLPVTTVRDLDTAIELAYQSEGGNRHTAAMHSMNVENLTRMGRRMACSIYVKNAPTLYGLGMGEGYSSMTIGTPTGDGITKPTHFVRPLHCTLVGYFRIA